MTIGSFIVVPADPLLWGLGQIRAFTRDGRCIVEFADLTRETFHPHELELHDRWQEQEPREDVTWVEFAWKDAA